jgi:autotransporter-associated beta strand protein
MVSGNRRTAAWKKYRSALYCSAALVTAALMSNAALATDYTGGNGSQGQSGSFPNTGCVCNSGQAGGTGGANGFGGGNAAAGGANGGYASSNLGGSGGAADAGGGGGAYYASGAGGTGGGAGGAGYLLTDTNLLNSSGAITGGNGGDGGYSSAYYGTPAYSRVGGGGGGGGGSGVIATGTVSLTNTGTILGGNGGTAASANYANYGNPADSDNGHGGNGGFGVRADSATALTLTNSGGITGGTGGYDYYGTRFGSLEGTGGAGIYGQNITLYNTAGTVKGGTGGAAGVGIHLTGGSNTLNISGGTVTGGDVYGYSGAVGIQADAGTNIFNINGGTVSTGTGGSYALQINGGTNTLSVTSGTLGAVYLAGGVTTLEGTGFSNAVTLAHGATASVTSAGGDVAGITSFDNHGSLSLDDGRQITIGTFTNESDGSLALGAGATLVSSNLNLIAGSTVTGAGSLSSGSAAYGLSSGSISAVLAGSGGLNKTGSGTLTLTGANTYTGDTNISGGTLAVGVGALGGGGDVHMAQGTTIQFTGSSFTTTNNFYISGDPAFNVASGTTQTVSSVIADDPGTGIPGVVEKTGAGELVLSGANTYSGGTIISAGQLTLGTATVRDGMGGTTSSAIGTGILTLDGGALATSAYYTVYNDILVNSTGGTINSGANFLEIDGDITDGNAPGTLTIAGTTNSIVFLSGTNSYSGATVISSGATLEPFSFDSLSASSNYTVNGALSLRALGGGTPTIKSLSGTGNVSNTTAGNAVLDIATASGQTATFSGSITDYGGGNPHLGIAITGAGTQIFAGSGDTYSGGTTLTSGILGIGANNALGNGGVTLDGGTLQAEGNYSLGNTIQVNGTAGTVDANSHALSLAALVDGTGVTSGTSLVFGSTGGAGTVALTGDSSYTGAIQINAGATLKQGGGNIMPGGAYLVNGGLQVSSATIASLNGSGTVQDSGSGGALDIEIASGSASFSGIISDSGTGSDILALTKGGAGAQTLTGNNTYSGGTTLNAGTLAAGGSNAFGTGQLTVTGGTLEYAGGITLANATQFQSDTTLTVAAGTATLTGDISDDNPATAYAVTKAGAGTLALSGANTGAVTTHLDAGTLEIGTQNSLGSGIYVFNGGTLKLDGDYLVNNDIEVDDAGGTLDIGNHAVTLGGDLSEIGGGTGYLSVGGAGSVTITGTNNLTGGTAVAAGGTLTVANAMALGSGAVSLGTGSTITFTNGSSSFGNQFTLDGDPIFDVDTGLTTTLTGAIADAASPAAPGVVEKTGAGILILTAANTYSGGTVLTGGVLSADNDGALGSGTLTFDGGTLASGINPVLGNAISVNAAGGSILVDDNTIELTGVIADGTGGGGVLTLVDGSTPGIVILSGINTFSQGTIVGSGVTAIARHDAAFGIGTIGLDGGAITPASGSTLTIGNDITLSANGGAILGNGTTLTVSGTISDLDPSHPGLLTFGAGGNLDTSTVVVSGGNSYTGGTTIAGGTVQVSGSSALGDSSGAVEMQSGTTLALASSASLANLLIVDDATPTLDVASGTATLSGGISEATSGGGFTKVGSGTLVLTGGSGNSGATIVGAGTLEIGDGAASSSSAYHVASGATLAFDSQTLTYALIGSLAGEGTVTSVSTLEVGGAGTNSDSTTFSGTITTAGLTYNGGGTLTLTGIGSDVGGLLVCGCVTSGGITLSGGSLTASGGVGVASGSLAVQDGVQLATHSFGQSGGAVTIDGASTVVDATHAGAGLIQIYSDGGAPVFTVSGGAHITSDTLLTGITSGTTAPQITVTGTGSVMSLTNGAQLDNGTVLTVAAGASLTTPSITLDHNSEVAIGNGAAAGTIGDASTTIDGLSSGTKLVADFTGTATVDALLTDALALDVQAGNLTITNVLNDYSGGTTIAHGATLTVQDNSVGTGAITDNGTLVMNNSSPVTFGNSLTGSGGLTQGGNGALTLNTAQTYTGRTVITGNATLFLAGAGDLSHSSNIQADGTFDILGVTAANVSITSLSGTGDVEIGSKTLTITGNGGVFSGILSDGGAHGGLDILGNQILNGVVSLTGTTTIGAGTTVTVSGPNALGGGMLDFKAGSILKFGASGTYTNGMTFEDHAPVFDVTGTTVTLSGLLAGPGDLAATGAGGTLTLTNAGNTYAGGTEVYGGSTLRVDADGELGGVAALQLGDATTQGTLKYASAFALASGRTLTVNAGGGVINTNGFDVTIASVIGGSGALTKAGAGNLILTGTSTLTGATTISGGTLSVNGSLASSAVAVASGGKLGGNGTVGRTSVASGGTVAPGNSIGTLHVNGNLALASGSTTAIEISPTAADQIAVSGTASLGGTLAFAQGAGTYAAGTDFKLITASAVNGTFASITGLNITGLNANVTYSATAVDLVLSAPGGSGTTGSSFLFATYGATPNQIAAGTALAAGSPTGALYLTMGGLVGTNTAAVPGALGQLAGDIHASLRSAAIEDSRIIRDTVLDHMNGHSEGIVAWVAGFGGYGSISTDGNASGLHHDSAGFIAGADMGVGNGLRLGLAGAYTANNASTAGKFSSASGSSGHLVGYGGWSGEDIDLKLGGDFGWGSASVIRTVTSLGQTNSDTQGQQTSQIFAEGGYRFATDLATVEPYIGIAKIWAQTGAFAEAGSASALSGAAATDNQTYGTLGLRGALAPVAELYGLVPHVDLGWQHGFTTLRSGQTVTFQNAGQGFTVFGTPLASDAAAARLGFDVEIVSQAALSLDYDGTFAGRVQNNAIRGGLEWRF